MVAALHSYPYLTWLRFWGSGSLMESNDVIMSCLRLTATSNCFPHPYQTCTKCLSTSICCLQAYSITLTQLYPSYFPQIWALGHLWSQNDVIMSWLRLTANSNCLPHPYQTYAKCLSTLICCPYAYGSSLTQLYTPTWLKFGGSESLVESKCCQYVLIETDSHLKLLPSSILDVYKVFEHIDMLSLGIQQQPYTVIPTLLGFSGVLGHMWSQNDIITS